MATRNEIFGRIEPAYFYLDCGSSPEIHNSPSFAELVDLANKGFQSRCPLKTTLSPSGEIVRKVSGRTARVRELLEVNRGRQPATENPLTDFAPFMIHEALPTLTETSFGSHPCCVVSVTYVRTHCFHGGNTGSNPVGAAKAFNHFQRIWHHRVSGPGTMIVVAASPSM